MTGLAAHFGAVYELIRNLGGIVRCGVAGDSVIVAIHGCAAVLRLTGVAFYRQKAIFVPREKNRYETILPDENRQ